MSSSKTDYNADLDQLAGQHYYSDEGELYWTARGYFEKLPESERPAFRAVFMERLEANPSISNIFLAGPFECREGVPIIVQELNKIEQPSGMSNIMMETLSYLGDEGYAAMERFLDSCHERETLIRLARMDFRRTLPHFRRSLLVDDLLKTCLHTFAARRKEVGLDVLIEELRTLLANDETRMRLRFRHALMVQDEPYNPLEPDEINRMLLAIG